MRRLTVEVGLLWHEHNLDDDEDDDDGDDDDEGYNDEKSIDVAAVASLLDPGDRRDSDRPAGRPEDIES